MGRPRCWINSFFVVALLALFTVASAFAQGSGRIFGSVLDADDDTPIAGALVRFENPDAVRTFEATTGEDGRFTVFGLTSGNWNVLVSADRYHPTEEVALVSQAQGQAVSVWLNRALSRLEIILGSEALAGKNAEAIEQDLEAADTAFSEQRWDDALAGYNAILSEVPSFTRLYLQIGNTYRAKGDYEESLSAYDRLLAIEPANTDAKTEIARTSLAMGDLSAVEDLAATAAGPNASREDLFNLGEVAFAGGDLARAAELYEKSSTIDPNWGKPLFKLALVALNSGDTETAKELLQKILAVDPDSAEGAMAETTLAALP